MQPDEARQLALRRTLWLAVIVGGLGVILGLLVWELVLSQSGRIDRTIQKWVGIVIAAALLSELASKSIRKLSSQGYPKPTRRHCAVAVVVVLMILLYCSRNANH